MGHDLTLAWERPSGILSSRCISSGRDSCSLLAMHRLALIWSLMIVSPVACSDSPSEEALTREGFCQRWATQACSDAVVSACQAADAPSCRLQQQEFCAGLVPSDFSARHAEECLSSVGKAYADADLTSTELRTVLELGAPCNRIVVGPSGNGDACSRNSDCDGANGFECVIKGAEGTCQKPEIVAAGLKCSAPQEVCGEGFYCNGDNCIAGKSVGQDCLHDSECGTSGTCSTDGICVARLPVNSPCSEHNDCLSGLCLEFSSLERTCVDRLRLSRSEPVCENLR